MVKAYKNPPVRFQRLNKKQFRFLLILLLFCFFPVQSVTAGLNEKPVEQTDFPEDSGWDEDFLEEEIRVRDPLEPANRVFFQFNDKLYFWFLKPVSKAYGHTVPRDFRLSFRNCYKNLMAPVSITNDFLQGDLKSGSLEACRFFINSTVGILGLADAAKDVFGLNSPGQEDLGQTMGYYGINNGLYFCWPFLGPSTLRDTVGKAGDFFLRPGTYITLSENSAVPGTFFLGKQINNTSLRIGEYEDFLKATFDPYLAMRDAYLQQRRKMIKE